MRGIHLDFPLLVSFTDSQWAFLELRVFQFLERPQLKSKEDRRFLVRSLRRGRTNSRGWASLRPGSKLPRRFQLVDDAVCTKWEQSGQLDSDHGSLA